MGSVPYQTFGSSVDNANKHEADGKPFLSVDPIKVTESDDAESLECPHACDADRGLNCQQQARHIEISSRNDILRSIVGHKTLFET